MSIALTNACDLACAYCYAPKHHARLSPDRLRAWITELDAAGTLGVGFGGGEPTLYRHLAEVCAFAADQTRMAVTMTTHGHRWDADLIERLRGAVHFVRISVDGVEATYERLRRRSFDALCDRLDLISQAFPIGLNCVVNEDTIDQLTQVAELASAHAASELLLLPEKATSARPGAAPEVVSALRTWVLAYAGPVPLAVSAGEASGLPTAVALPKEVGLRSYAHIDATGSARTTSYSTIREPVTEDGVLAAFDRLAVRGAA
ncbi:radical SAM protein [Nocardioides bruguierae]|uniref:radical SAM protein n=1 Tax=Nocardioides bruguierae TaxID=2945102 RepID=UPI0020226C7A|nr:radical SAM protein [Nocardioides bruguierae]MCL8023780.1 radical SAM protein [Nocardioides bruguierae]